MDSRISATRTKPKRFLAPVIQVCLVLQPVSCELPVLTRPETFRFDVLPTAAKPCIKLLHLITKGYH